MFSFKPKLHNSGKIGISGTGNRQKSRNARTKGKYWKDRNKQDLVVLFYCLMQPENIKKVIQWSPLCIIFKGKTKLLISYQNDQCIETITSYKLEHFWAALWTKKISFYKIAIFKWGWLSKFQSHRFWGDAHLSLGAAQAPPN